MGLRAVQLLQVSRTTVGPVVYDMCNGTVYWLTPPGSACLWLPRRGTRALGAGSWVVLPPLGWDGFLRWVVEPVGDLVCTKVDDLVAALRAATAAAPAYEETSR